MLTPQQITLVRDSFALVQPIAPQAAALFYGKLFAADPSLKALFRGNMVEQGAHLMDMIGRAVSLLEWPDALVPVLKMLGARHSGYSVRESHYATVGTALLDTLQEGLGSAFTPEVREAWTALYGVVSSTMIDASREAMSA